MQRSWSSELWLPTIRPDRLSFKDWTKPLPQQINILAQRLSRLTSEIIDLPYDPSLWSQRAAILWTLGYPELSVGDAYKARMLIDAAQSTNVSSLTDNVRLVVGMKLFCTSITEKDQQDPSFAVEDHAAKLEHELETLALEIWTILLRALAAANAYMDQAATMRRALKTFDNNAAPEMRNMDAVQQKIDRKREAAQIGLLTSHEKVQRGLIRNGSLLSRPYPWMTTDLLQRPGKLLSTMTQQMQFFSEGKCTIRKSQVQAASPDKVLKDDILGVYATRDISRGEVLFKDSTTTAVVASEKDRCALCCTTLLSHKAKCGGCQTIFCSQECLMAATLAGHLASCGRTMLYRGFGREDPTKYTRLARANHLMRYLEFIIQHLRTVNDAQHLHPLQVHPICRLTPKYTGTEIVPFNLLEDIVQPLAMLQTLDVDIFADHRFDTWVLFTMRSRLNNNVVGIKMNSENNKDYIYGVYPLMAVLNHSCDHQVEYNREASDAKIVLKAVKDIVKDEEIFTSYIPDDEDLGLRDRRASLMAWFGTECRCSRCVKEEREMNHARMDSESVSVK